MHVKLPGYYSEILPSGNVRHVVRKAGDKKKKITVPVGPNHSDFLKHYEAARQGRKLTDPSVAGRGSRPVERSLAWLMDQFEDWMQRRVDAGLLHSSTLQQRRQYYARLRSRFGKKHMAMPPQVIASIRDELLDTPAAADNMVKALKAMFAWASHPERGLLDKNPAIGIAKVSRDKGATPWTVEDLRRYRECHPKGSMAHLALSLFMFTACRISDAVRLGREHEMEINGIPHLSWLPSKKNSTQVTVPMLPPLQEAVRAQEITGPTYLLNAHGRSFSSRNSFDNRFRKWVIEAGLYEVDDQGGKKATRSSHGIRKAAGHLLALEGASQYHIMAVHGHSEAKTSEVYTKGVNRQVLAREAMELLAGMSW